MLNIRTAQGIDSASILKIIEDAWLELYVDESTNVRKGTVLDLGISSDENINHQASLLDTPSKRRIALIAEDNSAVVGFILLVKRDEGWYLKSLYINPDSRNKGIGLTLYKSAIERIFEGSNEGKREITLEVAKSNQGAVRFYARHGWRITGESKIKVGDSYLPTYIMRIELSQQLV